MADEVTTIESEGAPVVVLSDQGGAATEEAQSPEGESGDDKEYNAGIAQARDKVPAKEETEIDGRDDKGRFVKKDTQVEAEAKSDAGPTGEEDADILEGKSLLEQEQQATAERKQIADEERRKETAPKPTDAGKAPPLVSIEQSDADFYMKIGGPDLFKGKTVKVGDMEIDLGEYAAANPEVSLIAGAMFNNFLMLAMHQGIIPSADKMKKFAGEAWESENGLPGELDRVRNDLFVTNIGLHGVPNPEKIIHHEKFEGWFKAQKPEVQVLFRSKDPSHHATGLKRFMRDVSLPGVEKKKAVDAKARAVKEKKDALFGSTVKSGVSRGTDKGGGSDDDYDAGYDEARSHVRR